MPDKAEELSWLKLVYWEREFESIDPHDPFPDWVLKRPGEPPFGIEVTGFYHDETTARLLKDHSYRAELIKGGRARHKDDKVKAQVVTVEIRPGEPDSFKFQGVLVDEPPLTEYAPMIAARIRKESGKDFTSAPAHLGHVNLLIVDRDYRLGGVSVWEVCRHIFTPEMKQALTDTPYREVFLVTAVKEHKDCYYPLRTVFLASEAFALNHALNEFYNQDTGIDTWDEDAELCAEFLRLRGADARVAVGGHGRVEVVLGNAGLSATDEGVEVCDYFDHPLPPTRLPAPRPESCKLLTPEFFTFFDDWTRRKFFSSGLAYPIAGQTVSSGPPPIPPRSGSDDDGTGRMASVFW